MSIDILVRTVIPVVSLVVVDEIVTLLVYDDESVLEANTVTIYN